MNALRVLRRDVAVEFAGFEASAVVAPFVLAAVLLAGLGFGPAPDVLRAVAPGTVWLVVLVAATPLARTVAAAEREEGSWDLLRALVSPAALLGGKLAALWLWLATAWGVATLLVSALFATPPRAPALLAGLLGTLGLAAVTTLLGLAVAGDTRRTALLGVLLLPAGLPALLAGVQVSTVGVDPWPWIALVGAYDLIALAVVWAVFPVLLEE